MIWTNYAAAIGFAGIIAVGAAAPSDAGPMPLDGAALKAASPTMATEVQWRRWGGPHWRPGWRGPGWWGPAVAGGIIAGAAVGAAAGAAAAAPYYAPPPAYMPPPPQSCWTETDGHRGYGYWGPC